MSNYNTAKESNHDYMKENINDNEDFSLFNPILADSYKRKFIKIVKRILDEFPKQRSVKLDEIINESLEFVNNNDNPLEGLKYLSALSVLRDLIAQEWRIKLGLDNLVKLAPPKSRSNDSKFYLRQQLQVERNAQLKVDSVEKFIKRMENKKLYKNTKIDVSVLIGDSNLLYQGLKEIAEVKDQNKRYELSKKVVSPYLQLVTNERCSFTGYKLMDIWRYFRYTWSIPYKSTPGRNMFYLIRDSSQPFHPIIGITALGNTVLHLTKRDNYIGWTLESIRQSLKKRVKVENFEVMLKGEMGLTRNVEKVTPLETDYEYEVRVKRESVKLLNSIREFLTEAINEIYLDDLVTKDEIINPSEEVIQRLESLVKHLRKNQLNNKRSTGTVDWHSESQSSLFKKKRAQELSKLISAKLIIKQIEESHDNPVEIINKLVSYKGGKVLNIALQANRKKKIGSNVMEIIVCGSIPPYNELLGGKLVSILAMSPTVVKQYNERYASQVSEIASRMKGEKVIRDSQLSFLGTTSLYQMGSSQYNRIKVPAPNGTLEYKKLGETEGFGSVFFTNQTSSLINKMLFEMEGGRRINNVFGEGTSPRLRLLRSGLSHLGIPEQFTKHHTRRIVYGIELASNSREYLTGKDNKLNYYYPLDGNEDVYTNEMIDYWRKRWLLKRVDNVDLLGRLLKFKKESILVSNYL
ncbi:Druantia anti-phage system protein DruA [Neobacillus mesonae]|uniref:Druantia anti-phage system protein DruA n=1 Tax=Neobacillus mesonae TaxID=1193713 RepID=UPI00082CED72|nr:Druantia anti-phage system protein DruA [Neobacillus mesonae]